MAEKPSTHTKMIEPSSPLYLHPSDNPGATITTCVFNGENYDMWEKAVKNALRAKNKLGIIDGTVNKPKGEDGNELNAWEACNSMIISWMFNVIDKSLHSSVAYAQTTKDMWEDLKERYAVGNAPRVHQLRSEIVNLKQEGMTVAAYYAKIKGMWDELNQYIEIPECTCGAAQAIVKSREDEKAHQFLMGLDDTTFGTVRSSILALDPLPTLGKIYAMVTQEERHRSMARGADRAEITVFAAKTEKPGGQTNKSGSCTHCGKTGHDVADCFQLKGYPDWWPTRQMGRGRGRGRGRNSYAGRGATSGRVHYANAVAEADTQEKGQCVGHDVECSIIPGLNDDNFQKLMALLRSGSSNAEKLTGKNKIVEEWILDSGASMHMTGRRDLFDWLRKWETACVELPDGTKTVANEMRYVKLSKDLCLKNVLYVPSLKCNLISIGQLLKEKDYIVTFTDSFCVIQDRTSRNPIGVGKLRNGVYYYKPLQGEKVNAVKVEEKYELWHRRLGHPSDRVLASIHSLGNNVMKGIEDYVCDSCCRGKQVRNSFQLSNKRAFEIFNLIHVDIWGPYRTPTTSGAHYFLTIVDDHSRGVWIYLMKEKSETKDILQNFCFMTKTQFDKPVKCIRSDNGLEFCSGQMMSFYKREGILRESSLVNTPQQNGRVERKHQHILNIARTLRFQACLPIDFWGECVLTAAYLINRTPTPILDGKTPYEILFGEKPNYEHLRVFGSLCYAHKKSRSNDKFDARSRCCVFVGYP